MHREKNKRTTTANKNTRSELTLRLRKVSLQTKRGLNLMFTFKTGCDLLKLHIGLSNLDPVLYLYNQMCKMLSYKLAHILCASEQRSHYIVMEQELMAAQFGLFKPW